MIVSQIERNFESWRQKARELLASETLPDEVVWNDGASASLFSPSPGTPGEGRGEGSSSDEAPFDVKRNPHHNPLPRVGGRGGEAATVPREFLESATYVACHRDPTRWHLLYRILWRLTHGEPNLLHICVDDDVRKFEEMHRAVRRDRHKMTAFVRFRRIQDEAGEQYIAWYEPDHYIVRLASSHFLDRFAAMRWTIFTPDESVAWDGSELSFGSGVSRDLAPKDDELESLWTTYYATTFNPARIKLKAMRKEMPVRFWKNLPETQAIPDLLYAAPSRMEAMMKCQPKSPGAQEYVPSSLSLPQLRIAVQACKGCDLYCNATQAVFGEGPAHAKLMLVGEQPGDQEDLSGRPFVGPAGRLMNEVLDTVGLDRSVVYVTNAVKHFKFEPRGKRRMHATPNAREVSACRPWLEAEIQTIKPAMIVCLGATAAKSLMGNAFRITQSRGQVFTDQSWAPWMLATYHPSALLRVPDPEMAKRMRQDFTDDLKHAVHALSRLSKGSKAG